MSVNNKCLNCGGELNYNPIKNSLDCQYCGSTFPMQETYKEENISNLKREYSPSYVLEQNKKQKIKYQCSSCGSQLFLDGKEPLKRCSACGNTSLITASATTYVPDGIIPFSLSKAQAGEIFRKWIKSRKFAPSDLLNMAKLEKISGYYTPVWNFNVSASTRWSAVGINKVIHNDQEFKRRYEVKDVEDSNFNNVMKSGSSKFNDEFLDDMGDYDFLNLKPFSTKYLLGYAGVNTDKDIHKVYQDIVDDINQEKKEEISKRLNGEYDLVDNLSCQTRIRHAYFNYAYVPIWANHYTYKGKDYHCYINGQTGTATGKAPKSVLKIGGIILGIAATVVIGVVLLARLLF